MVKQGYKPTEIGVIPEDWEVRRLRETGTFFSTNSLSRDKLNYNNGTIYNIHYGDIHTQFKSHFNIQNEIVPFINNDIKPTTINLCKKGDLIIADASENDDDIGKAIEIINDGNKNIVAGLHTLHFRPFNDVFREGFLGHLWKTELMHLNILKEAQGTKVLGISVNRLLDLQIPLPPLAEQEAIASALSDADAWIERLEQLIAKKRLIKQGAMQTLLTPKEDWIEYDFNKVVWFQEGPGLRNWQFTKDGIKVINVTNLENGYLNLAKTSRHISWNEFERMYKHFEIDEGDIVVASSGNSYGKVSVVRKQDLPLVMNTSVIRFKPSDTIGYKYLLVFLKSFLFKDQIDLLITGGAQPNFGPAHLNKIKISSPKSLSEQERIATILSDMDAELDALETQLGKARQIKQGMMQELLTGRVRLV